MKTLTNFLIWLNNSRKLFLSVLFLLTIVVLDLILFIAFCIDWKIGTNVFQAQNLVDVFLGSFKVTSAVIVGYLGTNLGVHLTQELGQWLKKRKR